MVSLSEMSLSAHTKTASGFDVQNPHVKAHGYQVYVTHHIKGLKLRFFSSAHLFTVYILFMLFLEVIHETDAPITYVTKCIFKCIFYKYTLNCIL